nr:arylesterase [Beijerinckia indica]
MSGKGWAATNPLKIVALGDSLTAGYLLPAQAAFPVVLEKALRNQGYDVRLINAGVSGDTAAGGLARLDWSLGEGVDGVIVELGANDMLRGIDPASTRATLAEILTRLRQRRIKALLAGMRAAPNLDALYREQFEAIYPALAQQFDVPFYPFFLDGVAGNPALELPDRVHPNQEGVERIVEKFLPLAERFVQSLGS